MVRQITNLYAEVWFSSMLTGYIKSVTGSTAGGLYANASIFLLGVVLLLVFPRRGAGDRPAGRGE